MWLIDVKLVCRNPPFLGCTFNFQLLYILPLLLITFSLFFMKADKLFYVLFYLVHILFSENESRYFWISLEFSVLAFGLNLTDWHVIFTIEKPLKVHLIFNFSLYFRSLISFFPHKILHFCIKVCDLKNWSWKMIFFRANFPNLLTRILRKNFLQCFQTHSINAKL